MKIISRIKDWYLTESKNLTVEPSSKKMELYFNGTFSELGLDADGVFPLSEHSIDWSEYDK